MNWTKRLRHSLGKRLARAKEKCPDIETIRRVGKEVAKEVIETVEIEAEEMAGTPRRALRWTRHNPIKTVIGIIAAVFILK